MNNVKLLRFSRCWADEFDVTGIGVVGTNDWEAVLRVAEDMPHRLIEWYFGTNEGFTESLVDMLKSFEAVDITDEELLVLVTKLPMYVGSSYYVYEYGSIPDIVGDLLDSVLSEEDRRKYFPHRVP